MTILNTPAGLSYLDFQNTSISYALMRRKTLIADEPGLGKGHPLTTRILTPEGHKAIGEIKLGDRVIGSNGAPVEVTGVFDRGLLPVYRVTTGDGASTIVDGDHLWTLFDSETGEEITINTLELNARIARGDRLSLPLVSSPVEFTAKQFAIPPKLAGLMAANKDLYEDSQQIGTSAYEVGSPSQRIDFLSAVVRTLGRVRGDDNCIRLLFYRPLENRALATTVSALVRSLGGLAYETKTSQRIRLDIYLPDTLFLPVVGYTGTTALGTPRKRINRRWKRFVAGTPDRHIVSVRGAGRDHVRCISVNAHDNLYVTEEYIVTHNTVSAIGLSNQLPEVRSMLVICLASHKIHWARAVEKWDMHELSVGIADGDFFPDTECVVINYDILHRHYDTIRAGKWGILICDEAHVLQNESSRRSLNVFGGKLRVVEGQDADDVDDDGNIVKSAFKKKKGAKKVWKHWEGIEADREVYLTGTPIPNRVKNMWTIIKRCDPRGIGRNKEAFLMRYCGAFHTLHGLWDNGATNLPELNRILKDRFMVRHLKNDVLKSLPPKVRQAVPLSNEGLQKKLQAEKDAVSELLAAYEAKMGIHVDLDQESLADLVMRARPQMFDDYAKTVDADGMKDTPLNKLAIARAELALAKVPMAIEYIANLINQGKKVVVFAYHREVIEALRARWSNSCALIYGGTPTHKRQAEADRFQEDPECNPFIGQYTAAGTGYTLIEAYHVVCVEMTWLPYELSQAEDRCHRIGQEDTVFVHHLIVEGSMDEAMLAKIVAKQEIIDAALN